MSECVVRMEMPENCKKCKNPLCIWCDDYCDFIVDPIIAAVQDFRKKNDGGFPDFCPIICQLPEGHGRLIDWDAFERIGFKLCRKTSEGRAELGTPTNESYVVPAERSET